MSGPQTKKKNVAQFRAEKEQRERDFDLGCQLADVMADGLNRIAAHPTSNDVRYTQLNALLSQADAALELLQFHADTYEYRLVLSIKAEIHKQLEQYRLALATYRQADEAFAMAERK